MWRVVAGAFGAAVVLVLLVVTAGDYWGSSSDDAGAGATMVVAEPASLEGTWELVAFAFRGENDHVRPGVNTATTPFIAIGSSVSGSTGCNRFNAMERPSWTYVDGVLAFNTIVATQQGCVDPDGHPWAAAVAFSTFLFSDGFGAEAWTGGLDDEPDSMTWERRGDRLTFHRVDGPGASLDAAPPTTTPSDEDATPTSGAATSLALLRTTIDGVIEFDASAFVTWGDSEPGCSLTGEWEGYLQAGADVFVLDRHANVIGRGVLGAGQTMADMHCHFPFEVEIPTYVPWYSVCVTSLGPFAPVRSDDLSGDGWRFRATVAGVAAVAEQLGDYPVAPTEGPVPCNTYLGSRFGPLDSAGYPPHPHAESQWAYYRDQWEATDLQGYTVEYTRSTSSPDTPGRSDLDGAYRIVVEGDRTRECRFTPAHTDSSYRPCDDVQDTRYSPVEAFLDLLLEHGRTRVAAEFDPELFVPVVIHYDDPSTIGEEYMIEVTDIRGQW